MSKFEDSTEDLLARAWSADSNEQLDDALKTYKLVLARLAGARSAVEREQATRALHGVAYVSRRLGRTDDVVTATEALIVELKSEQDSWVLVALARALLGISNNLNADERWESALAIYETLIARLEDSNVPALRQEVALALTDSSLPLVQLGRDADAIAGQARMVDTYGPDAVAAFEQIAMRFEDSVEPDARAECASALCNRALVLSELGHIEEARVGFTDLIRRFEHDDLEAVQVCVTHARQRQTLLPRDH